MTTDAHLHIVNHPVVQDSLTLLRDKNTDLAAYRFHSDRLCQLLFIEAIHDLATQHISVETPLETTQAPQLAEEVVIVPILRAGLAMMPGALQFLPQAKVGFVGLERNEETAIAREYYWKLPKLSMTSVVLVTDPMLATGGSSLHVLQRLKSETTKKMILVCVIAAPEGVAAIRQEFPELDIYTAALDDHLNDKKYIVPGLGDYGDRYFGTTG